MKRKGFFRLILISTVSLLLLSYPSVAGNPVEECANRIWQKFQKDIKYPEFAHKQALQGEVIVLFMISEEGKIIVKDLRSTEAELGIYIRNAISAVQCPELKNAGDHDFKVKFHFRLV
jgi:hypothetical protein